MRRGVDAWAVARLEAGRGTAGREQARGRRRGRGATTGGWRSGGGRAAMRAGVQLGGEVGVGRGRGATRLEGWRRAGDEAGGRRAAGCLATGADCWLLGYQKSLLAPREADCPREADSCRLLPERPTATATRYTLPYLAATNNHTTAAPTLTENSFMSPTPSSLPYCVRRHHDAAARSPRGGPEPLPRMASQCLPVAVLHSRIPAPHRRVT